MLPQTVDVLASGAVCLGSKVVCDGFIQNYPFRVQTHVHDDHMVDFNTSKGMQDILMSPETFDLLVAERNADLEYRDNLLRIKRNNKEYILDDGSKLYFLPSNHMLGSCQVALELPDGQRVGYSGDFGWPIQEAVQVDRLVVDSTYGKPSSIRHYTQAKAEDCLLSIVCERLRHGPVHIKAFRGTIERALQVLDGRIGVPLLASEHLVQEISVYQKYGLSVESPYTFNSEMGQTAKNERSYVRLYSKGDSFDNEPAEGTTITCSAYMVNGDNPLLRYSDRSYRVALSNHADFQETLEYISATGAREIITDNTRNYGVELAKAINERLSGVKAKPSTNYSGPKWS